MIPLGTSQVQSISVGENSYRRLGERGSHGGLAHAQQPASRDWASQRSKPRRPRAMGSTGAMTDVDSDISRRRGLLSPDKTEPDPDAIGEQRMDNLDVEAIVS